MRESAAEKAWKKLLQPMANDYSAMVAPIISLCEGLADDKLAELIDATYQPTQSNCWWATYAAAAVVRQEAEAERYRRAHIAAGVPLDASLESRHVG